MFVMLQHSAVQIISHRKGLPFCSEKAITLSNIKYQKDIYLSVCLRAMFSGLVLLQRCQREDYVTIRTCNIK